MAATFNPSLSDAISRVRQMLGDTVVASALIEDETIEAYLTSRGELATAAQLARDLSARYANQIDTDVDGQAQRNSQRFRHFKELAAQLEAQAQAETKVTTAGSTSFYGVAAFGTTAAEVTDARDDCTRAENAPTRWGW